MIRISTSNAMMISVVEMTMRDWPPASACSTWLGLCGKVGELLALERRDRTLRAAQIEPDIAGDGLDFRPFEQPQHRLTIGGGRGRRDPGPPHQEQTEGRRENSGREPGG